MNQAHGHFARPADTSPEAFRVEIDALNRLGLEGRSRLTFQLMEQLRVTVEAGIHHRHPDYTPAQVQLARNRLWWGDALFQRVFPGVEIET